MVILSHGKVQDIELANAATLLHIGRTASKEARGRYLDFVRVHGEVQAVRLALIRIWRREK